MAGKNFFRISVLMLFALLCVGGFALPQRAEAATCSKVYRLDTDSALQRSSHGWLWPFPENQRRPSKPTRYNRPECGNGGSHHKQPPHHHQPHRGHR